MKTLAGPALLIISTVALLLGISWWLPDLDAALTVEVAVPWQNTENVDPRPGPSWFFYDRIHKQIKTTRPVTDAKKRDLLDLVDGPNAAPYREAINDLAFRSTKTSVTSRVLALVLALGMLCGMLGVMIRSLSSYVFHSCFVRDLNLVVWWPWYVMRPFLGSAVGLTLIVLLKSKLLNLSEPDEFGGYWVLGLCIIAGFGADEFLDRLFYLSRTLFGESSDATTKLTNANG